MKLEVRDASVDYGGVAALGGVSMAVEPGTIHGVIGPNGAGKTTLINVISGGQRPTAGGVFIDDVDVTSRSIAWRRRRGLARTFQRTSVFPQLTVGEQLELAARGTRARAAGIATVVSALELTDVYDARCDSLAYGHQRVVDCALALVGAPEVVLLDEPAAGLADAEAATLLDHVQDLCREKRMGVLLVEHDVESVFRVSDVVTVLNLGKVIAHGQPHAVREEPQVIEAYLGSEE